MCFHSDSAAQTVQPQSSNTVVAKCVAAALELRIERRDEVVANAELTPFDSASTPELSLSGYLERLAKYCKCGGECFIVALIYADQISQKIPITPRNAHRFFLACLLGAVKFYDDKVPLNAYYAKCGGVCLREMNRLERFFLKVAGFKLHVDPEKYAEYECSLKGPAKNLGMPSTMPITEGLPSTKLIANNSSPTTSQTTSSTTSPTSSPTTTPTTTPSNQQSVTEHPEDFETIPVPNLHFTGATPKSAETVAITQSGPMVPTSVVPHAASEAPLVHAMHLRVAPGLWVETVPVLQHPELLFCRASVKDRWVACPY